MRETGREFVYLNTHLDHVSEAARLNGSRLILDRLGQIGLDLPCIISADFNQEPGSSVYRLFVEAGLQDAHLAAGGSNGSEVFTFHRFTGARELGRIDWILCSRPLRVTSCHIVTDAERLIYPSDHFPVVAELSWT